MYSIVKTVYRSGKIVSQELSEILFDWNEAQDRWKKEIKDRLKEAKKFKKQITNEGGGVLTTRNGFKITYQICLLSNVTPEE